MSDDQDETRVVKDVLREMTEADLAALEQRAGGLPDGEYDLDELTAGDAELADTAVRHVELHPLHPADPDPDDPEDGDDGLVTNLRGPDGEPPLTLSIDPGGCAIAEDSAGDRWVRRPDTMWELIGGPVYSFEGLVSLYGPLRLLDHTPASAGAAEVPDDVEPAAGPDPYVAVVELCDMVASGRPGERLEPGDVERVARAVAALAAALNPTREDTTP